MARNQSYKVVLGLSAQQLQNGLKRAEASLNKFKMRVASIGASMAGAIGFGGLLKEMTTTARKMDQASTTLKNVSNGYGELVKNQNFARDMAKTYNQELITITNNFADFHSAADQSNMALQDQYKIFESLTKASTYFNLSADETNGVFLAITQMMSKGKVATEELRRQLGERLPGAFGIFASALGMSTAELDKALRNGEIMAKDALPKLADELNKTIGSFDVDTIIGKTNKLRNAFTEVVEKLNVEDKMKNVIDKLASGVEWIGNNIKRVLNDIYSVIAGFLLNKVGMLVISSVQKYKATVQVEIDETLAQIKAADVKLDKLINKTKTKKYKYWEVSRNANDPNVFDFNMKNNLNMQLLSQKQQNEAAAERLLIENEINNTLTQRQAAQEKLTAQQKLQNSLWQKSKYLVKSLGMAIKSLVGGMVIGALATALSNIILKLKEARKEAKRIYADAEDYQQNAAQKGEEYYLKNKERQDIERYKAIIDIDEKGNFKYEHTDKERRMALEALQPILLKLTGNAIDTKDLRIDNILKVLNLIDPAQSAIRRDTLYKAKNEEYQRLLEQQEETTRKYNDINHIATDVLRENSWKNNKNYSGLEMGTHQNFWMNNRDKSIIDYLYRLGNTYDSNFSTLLDANDIATPEGLMEALYNYEGVAGSKMKEVISGIYRAISETIKNRIDEFNEVEKDEAKKIVLNVKKNPYLSLKELGMKKINLDNQRNQLDAEMGEIALGARADANLAKKNAELGALNDNWEQFIKNFNFELKTLNQKKDQELFGKGERGERAYKDAVDDLYLNTYSKILENEDFNAHKLNDPFTKGILAKVREITDIKDTQGLQRRWDEKVKELNAKWSVNGETTELEKIEDLLETIQETLVDARILDLDTDENFTKEGGLRDTILNKQKELEDQKYDLQIGQKKKELAEREKSFGHDLNNSNRRNKLFDYEITRDSDKKYNDYNEIQDQIKLYQSLIEEIKDKYSDDEFIDTLKKYEDELDVLIGEAENIRDAADLLKVKEDIKSLRVELASGITGGLSNILNYTKQIKKNIESLIDPEVSGVEKMLMVFEMILDTVNQIIGAMETIESIQKLILSLEGALTAQKGIQKEIEEKNTATKAAELAIDEASKTATEAQTAAEITKQGVEAAGAADKLAATSTQIAANEAEALTAGAASAAKSISPFGIAGIVLGVVGIIASLSAIFSKIPKYANSGIVGGHSATGDKLLARVNSGEVILNKKHQNALLNQLEGNGGKTEIQLKVRGSDLVAVLNNYNKKMTK